MEKRKGMLFSFNYLGVVYNEIGDYQPARDYNECYPTVQEKKLGIIIPIRL